jgi:hypothetical protein
MSTENFTYGYSMRFLLLQRNCEAKMPADDESSAFHLYAVGDRNCFRPECR